MHTRSPAFSDELQWIVYGAQMLFSKVSKGIALNCHRNADKARPVTVLLFLSSLLQIVPPFETGQCCFALLSFVHHSLGPA